MSITVKHGNITAEVSISTHYRSAPACSNPDSSAFSDPGDDCEFVIEEAWYNKGDSAGRVLYEGQIEELYKDKDFYQKVCEEDERTRYEKFEVEYEPK